MKFKLLAAPLVLVLLLGVGWVAQSQPVDTMKRLPAGAWTLVDRESGHALLAPKPRRNQNVKGLEKAVPTGQALMIGPGGSATLIPTRSRGLFVGGPDSQPRVWSTQFMGRRVLFNPGGGGPSMSGIPGRAGDYIFSAEGTLWHVGPGSAPEKLAADSVAGFSRDSLADSPGFEEGGGLMWAAAPLASPDGRLVAYVSNREAFNKAEPAGQSVWIVDNDTGEERALLARSGESFTPLGWMGEELLFTDSQGGISAVHPASGQVHSMGGGTLIGFDSATGAIALLEGNLPGRHRLVILKQGERIRAARYARYEYAGSADFSPDGSRLAVVLSAPDGYKQIQIVDVATGRSQLLPLPHPRRGALTDPPRWVDDETLLITTDLRRGGEERSSLLPVPVSNAQ